MGNSTYTLRNIVDDAAYNADISPLLSAPNSAMRVLSIANSVMDAMVKGGTEGQPLNWKWNRTYCPAFYSNSYQQDYAGTLKTIGWLEHARVINFNSTTNGTPKETYSLEVAKDLDIQYQNFGRLGKISWQYNNQLLYGQWGQSALASITGLNNPGANVVYTDPTTGTTFQGNPITQIQDTNGNLLVLTTYGTCGSSQPTWPAANAAAGTTVTDGSVVWTVVDPVGQGFRVSPLPPQNGVVWKIIPVAQLTPVKFTTLAQKLDPIPDEYYNTFKEGFFAECYRRCTDAATRKKFQGEWAIWMKSLDNAIKAGSRENEDYRFYPETSIMDDPYGVYIGPANPFGGWGR